MSNTEKPVVLVDNYGAKAPAASRFGIGASNLAQINEATAARRALSEQQPPKRRDSR